MTEDNHDAIRKELRIHRVRRRFFSFFKKSIPWLIGGLVVVWAAGFFLIAPAAEKEISQLCGGAVYVKSAHFKGFGGVRLKGVVIAEDAEALANAPIFRFDEINVTFNPWKLLRAKFEVDTIRLSDFLFNATCDRQKRWNFSPLFAQRWASGSGKIPLIEIRNGAMRVSRIEEDGLRAITTVSLNGQVAVQTGKREYSFSLATDGRFGFGDSTLQGSLTLGRAGEKNRFVAEGKIQMPKTKVFENAWNLNDVRLECEFDRQAVLLKRCEFSMGAGTGDIRGAVRDDGQGRKELNLNVNLHNLALSSHYEKDAIVYSQPVLALLDPGLRRFLNEYHPTGTGDAEFSIQGHLDDLSATVINGKILCRDISVLNEDFPYRLEKMQGQIVLLGRNLTLDRLRASHGEVTLQIDGSIQNLGPKAEIDFRTTSPNMLFDADLYQALNDSVKRVWFSFTPSGRTAIDYHFHRSSDGKKDFSLLLELQEADLVYEHFPYPLENLTGAIVLKSDSVEIKELVSHYHDERKITLNGKVFEVRSQQPKFQIHVEAERIPVDDLLVNAMPPQQRDFFDKLDVDAIANVEVDVFPNVVGKRYWDYIAKIQVDGTRFVYSDFPVPMDEVHLTADITHEVVRLHHFEGQTGSGKVLMSGTLLPKGAQARPGLCLDLNLKAFDFNETFWAAVGQDVSLLPGKLRVHGKMDVKGHMAINMSGNSCPSTDLMIQCSDNPALWSGNQLGLVGGQIHLMGSQVLFTDFTLKEVSLESVPEHLLRGKLKTIYSGLEPQGKVDFRVDHGAIQLADDGLEKMDVEGAVTFNDVTAGDDGIVSKVAGEIDGRLFVDYKNNRWRANAAYDLEHFNYRHWQASNVQGDIVYDPNTRYLESREFVADFYGGKMLGNVVVDLSKKETVGYKLGLSINEVNVPQLLAAEKPGSLERVRQGLAYGALSLEGDLGSPSQRRGKVTANIVNMRLGKQSTMGKILTTVQFKQPDEYVFSEVQSQAFIRGSELVIEDLRMVGKPLVFRGKGKIDLEKRQIQMELAGFDRLLGTEDTILDLLARGIGSAMWKIEVRGSLDNPQVDAVFLSVLKQPLDLFKKKE